MRSLLARLGLGAVGTIYVAMGVVSARVAFLGAKDREAGVPGALRFLLGQPYGFRILGVVVGGLGALAILRFREVLGGGRSLPVRAGLALNAIGYALLAWTAARLLFRIRQSGDSLERASVEWLLGESWGATLLEVVGFAVIAGGAFEAYQGLRGRLGFRPRLPRRMERILAAIARFGLIARGIVLGVLGYFVIRAAEELDVNRLPTMGGTLRAFAHTAFGPAFMGVVAAGLASYGVYMWSLMLLKRRV